MRARAPAGERFLGFLKLTQSPLPAAFQLGSDQTIVGINPVVLSLGQKRLIAQPFDLLRLCTVKFLASPQSGILRSRPRLQLGRRDRRKESLHHLRVYRIGREMLA
jgi:hypothetical protein